MRKMSTARLVILLCAITSGCMKAERLGTDTNSSNGLLGFLVAVSLPGGSGPTYSGAKYVAVGECGLAAWSEDGVIWNPTNYACTAPGAMKAVAFNGTRWVAVGYDNGTSCGAWYSDDGKSWTPSTCPTAVTTARNAVAYGNGIFLAGGEHVSGVNTPMISGDGIMWTVGTGFAPISNVWESIHSLAFDRQSGRFLGLTTTIISTSGHLIATSDGRDWGAPVSYANASPPEYSSYRVLANPTGGLFRYAFLGSSDTTYIYGLTVTAGLGVSESSAIALFDTGSVQTSDASYTYGKGAHVFAGDNAGTCATFSYLTSLTSATCKLSNPAVAYHGGDGQFVMAGLSGSAWVFQHSPDGVTWNSDSTLSRAAQVHAIGVSE